MSVSYGQLRGMLCVPASLPPWMTSTLNAPSGNRKCVYRGLAPSELILCGCGCVCVQFMLILPLCLFSVGQVVNIKAKVNRAFNTSMEVRQVCVVFLQHITYVLHSSTSTNTPTHFLLLYSTSIIPVVFLCNKLITHKVTIKFNAIT